MLLVRRSICAKRPTLPGYHNRSTMTMTIPLGMSSLDSTPSCSRPRTPPRREIHHRQPKTVVVLGAAYGGARAARMLAHTLPEDWRLVVIDRNSHMNRGSFLPLTCVALPRRCFPDE